MFKPESDCLLKCTSSDESLLYGSFLNSVLLAEKAKESFAGSFKIKEVQFLVAIGIFDFCASTLTSVQDFLLCKVELG